MKKPPLLLPSKKRDGKKGTSKSVFNTFYLTQYHIVHRIGNNVFVKLLITGSSIRQPYSFSDLPNTTPLIGSEVGDEKESSLL